MFSRELASDLIFDRFVDRDMYMRYAGGGIGHYKVKISDTRSTESSVLEEELEDFDVLRTETSDDSENGSSDADSRDDGDGAAKVKTYLKMEREALLMLRTKKDTHHCSD